MKNTHKMKGYHLDMRINKSAYLDFKQQMLTQKFEITNENKKQMNIQLSQTSFDEENHNLSSSLQNMTQSQKLKKYVIQSQITEFPLLSSLNKIELYLNRQQNELIGQSKVDEIKSQRIRSQSTEMYSTNQVA